MKKELLTKERIKIDLRQRIKAARVRMIIFAAFTVIASVLFISAITALPLWHPNVVSLLFRNALLLLIPLLCLIMQTIDLVRYHRIVTSPDYITTDKLISSEEIEDPDRTFLRIRKYYRFHFSCHGTYHPTDEQYYTWSKEYVMGPGGLYHCAENGDTFYLVLSKPHTGKVLAIYNTKMFELQK